MINDKLAATGYTPSACPECGIDHPTGKRHCEQCGKPSAFIQDDGLCLKCRAKEQLCQR